MAGAGDEHVFERRLSKPNGGYPARKGFNDS
jgi:hypothetical protein